MKMSEPSTLPLFNETELPLTRSPVVSPAKTLAALESELASRVSDRDCGQSSRVLLANFDPDTRSWRTSQTCVLEDLERFSETWPRSGMMRTGSAFQRKPLAPLTDETGSGSLPTPTVGDSKSARNSTARRNKIPPTGIHAGHTLTDFVTLWPTPTAVNNTGGAALCKWGGAGAREKLRRMVTPEELNGPLNPTWVEWLMGFPLGWTDCGPSETRSSPRSSK